MKDVLKNPHRRKILEILYNRKTATAKEISEELRIGIPTVYYHLELMRGLVVKSSRGEFAATEMGLALYREALKEEMSTKSTVGRLVPYLVIARQVSSPKRLLPMSIAIGVVEYLICYFQYFRPYLFSYSRSIDFVSLPLYYLSNVLLLFAVLEVSSYALTRRVGGELALINGIMFSRIPLMLVLLVPILGVSYAPVSIATLALGQLVSILVLSIFTSLSKGVRQEVAIIICLIMLYFEILLYTSLWL
ncbi:MAG: helix-turn-helix transcriptional regulator [Candidatus Verstraetearchaeota archaeon]|nr:helix-turn-helix transcriptional regulator [Candidatus Verstraetearchaeota archaeon]